MSKRKKTKSRQVTVAGRAISPWWLALGAVGLAIFLGVQAGGGVRGPDAGEGIDLVVVAAGEQIYTASCASCHGADLRGTSTGPPFLNVIYAPNHHGDEAFQQAAALGVTPHHWEFGPMPPVAGLTRDEVSKIVAFVRSEQQLADIVRDPSHP